MADTIFTWLWHLLQSGDAALSKRGLQELCSLLEGGVTLPRVYHSELLRMLSRHLDSSDLLVRRWTYKAIGLFGARGFTPALRGKIARHESDPENITWAIAAFRRLEPRRSFDQNALVGVSKAASDLAQGYFAPSLRPKSLRALKANVNDQDSLSLLWTSLIYGVSKGRVADSRAKPLIQELNHHDDAAVVEYSIWALNEAPSSGFSDILIYPQDLNDFPPNVRRWYFRLLTKDLETLYGNISLVERSLSSTTDARVREGIAIGLRPHRLDGKTADLLVDWFRKESIPIIRAQLIRHFVAHQDVPLYHDALLNESRSPRDDMSALLLPTVRPAGVTNIYFNRGAIMGKPSADIQMVDRDRHNTYVIAVDTVDFSSEQDSVQLTIFGDLLNAVALLPTDGIEDKLVLMTGDGLILALRCAETAPLKLAVRLVESWSKTKTKKIRVGINFGSAFWITMSDGSRQLIGHTINWAVRIMTAAPDSGISVDTGYYEKCVLPSANEFKGLTFKPAEDRKTKKGEAISAVDVLL